MSTAEKELQELAAIEASLHPISGPAREIHGRIGDGFLEPPDLVFVTHVDSIIASISTGKVVQPDYSEVRKVAADQRHAVEEYRLALEYWLLDWSRERSRVDLLVSPEIIDEVFDTLGMPDEEKKPVVAMVVARLDPVHRDLSRPQEICDRLGTWEPDKPGNLSEALFHEVTRLDLGTWKMVPNIRTMIGNIGARARVQELHCWIGNPADIPKLKLRVKAITDWLDDRTEEPDTQALVATLGDKDAYKEKVWLGRVLLRLLQMHATDVRVIHLKNHVSDNGWSRQAWDASVSAQAYNADWWETLTPEAEPELWEQLRCIHAEEVTAGEIPGWAREIVARMMELPMCGYYAFPDNIHQIINAISAQKCPDVVLRCYTVDPDRKTLMSYYVFCLDAWLKGAPLELTVAELTGRDQLRKKWERIASEVYRILGERTEPRRIAVKRLIHRLRWWVKSLIGPDDRRDRFMLDVYSGDIRGDEERWGAYGNSPYGDPYFTELRLPAVQAMESELRGVAPNADKLIERIHSTWLCAPKVFRYVEKIIAEIGSIGSPAAGETGRDCPSGAESGFLQCEDTYPDFTASGRSFDVITSQLQAWLDGGEDAVAALGATTPVKHWLLRILWHKLVFQAQYEENFSRLVGKRAHGRAGTARPSSDRVV